MGGSGGPKPGENRAPARGREVPEPLEPKLSPPRVRFESATSSFTLRAGTDGWSDSTLEVDPSCVIAIRSLRASKGRFGYSVTFTATAVVVRISVWPSAGLLTVDSDPLLPLPPGPSPPHVTR